MAKSSAASRAFTDELRPSIEPLYAAILRHPFIAGPTDGSLPRESRIRRGRWTASSVCPLRPASASRSTRRCWRSDGWSCREAER